ncbi:uncharacterized protein LOC143458323 isoform X2 [Clavelina lepadiformis]|uniref:uncharacterized protein LOC143458323 isoform X2 n=1 Tax=Clavelina lepadiformis TaxID=159417 RepID=UPI004042A50F
MGDGGLDFNGSGGCDYTGGGGLVGGGSEGTGGEGMFGETDNYHYHHSSAADNTHLALHRSAARDDASKGTGKMVCLIGSVLHISGDSASNSS